MDGEGGLFSWSLTNIANLDLDGRLRVPSLTLNGSDLSDTLGTKQSTLSNATTGTQLLSGTTVRSLVAGSNVALALDSNDENNSVVISSTPLPPTELTLLHQNFTLSGGGTLTVKNVSGLIYIRWSNRMLATPLCGKASSTYYEVTCPPSTTAGTIGTGHPFNADGISLGSIAGNYAALYYVLPTTQTTNTTLNPPRYAFGTVTSNFRLITYLNSTENVQPSYVLVAHIFTDAGQAVVKWHAGNVAIPIPNENQQITWNANSQQLGRGANKITLDGGTGNVSVPGTLTVSGVTTTDDVVINENPSDPYGRLTGPNKSHAIILRGDATSVGATAYAITPGGSTAFIDNGGTWRFRQIHDAFNIIRFEITPTHVNVPTTLQINGTSTDTLYMGRPWVQCLVNANGGIQTNSDTGRNAPTITKTSAGAYDIGFPTHPRSFNYTSAVQVRVDAGLAFAVVSNQLSNALKVRTYNASQTQTDLQFSLTIFA